jgi:hypothetical protein
MKRGKRKNERNNIKREIILEVVEH